MSDLFEDIIKKGPSAASVSTTESDNPDAVATPLAMQKEPKGRPGRPKKAPTPEHNDKFSATRVCYVTTNVKILLKRIQASQVINNGNADTESRIIESALQLYVKHNKLGIN